MRSTGFIVASLLHGALSSVLPRQENSLNAAWPIRAADSGSGIAVDAPSGVITLILDGKNGTGIDGKTSPGLNPGESKVVDAPAYYPDFHRLCASHGQVFRNMAARCVPGYDRFFRYSCVDNENRAQVHDDWCDNTHFCLDVDGKDNVATGAHTVVCAPVKKEGAFSTGNGNHDTDKVCTTKGSKSNKFFGKVAKKIGEGFGKVTFWTQEGSNAARSLGYAISDGSVQFSQPFTPDLSKTFCWWATVYNDRGAGTGGLTVDWEFGLAVEKS